MVSFCGILFVRRDCVDAVSHGNCISCAYRNFSFIEAVSAGRGSRFTSPVGAGLRIILDVRSRNSKCVGIAGQHRRTTASSRWCDGQLGLIILILERAGFFFILRPACRRDGVAVSGVGEAVGVGVHIFSKHLLWSAAAVRTFGAITSIKNRSGIISTIIQFHTCSEVQSTADSLSGSAGRTISAISSEASASSAASTAVSASHLDCTTIDSDITGNTVATAAAVSAFATVERLCSSAISSVAAVSTCYGDIGSCNDDISCKSGTSRSSISTRSSIFSLRAISAFGTAGTICSCHNQITFS